MRDMHVDKAWHAMMLDVLRWGEPRQDRTGVGTRALFGLGFRVDLRQGFPAVTTKKLHFAQVAAELSAFVAGAETLAEFNRVGCTIWDANASAEAWKVNQRFPGDVGRIYGVQWRRWRSVLAGRELHDNPELVEVDQLRRLVEGIRLDPHGRRHVVTAWNPGELEQMCLPPCHVGFQCFASDEGKGFLEVHAVGSREPAQVETTPRGSLDLAVHLRSLDLFLGMPFDVASYALLLHLLARETGRAARHLVLTAGDAHVYNNHAAQAAEVLSREPMPLPRLAFAAGTGLFGFLPADARLEGYVSHPPVSAPLNV